MFEDDKLPDPAVPGDFLPNIVLPDAEESGVGTAQQTRAGRWIIMSFVEPEMAKEQGKAMKAQMSRLEACEGLGYTIAMAKPDQAIVGADLFDGNKGATNFLIGDMVAGIAVISPSGRLAARFDAGEIEKAVSYCESEFASDTPGIVDMAAPVLIIPNLLEPTMCERILDFWKYAPKTDDAVASSASGNDAIYSDYKRRTDANIPDGELFVDIRVRLTRRVLPLISRAFRLQVASMEALRVGCYSAENNGGFERHRDNTTPFTAHRKLAMSVNLNTGAYKGGEIRFPEYGRKLYSPGVGGAVVFSCSLLHEALPVTEGERFGMFSFFTDAEGLEHEKAMHQQMQEQQGQQGQLGQQKP